MLWKSAIEAGLFWKSALYEDRTGSGWESAAGEKGGVWQVLDDGDEFDTLNTIVKRCMAISSRFGQEHTVITVDQALYYRLMELKWYLPQCQDKLIPGLQVSMNFLKAIGDHMNGSGLADVWGEMGLLGPGAVELVLAG